MMSTLLIWLGASLAATLGAQLAPPPTLLLERAMKEGTPLVDRLRDPHYVRVTFVWRGSPSTQNVAVVGTFLKAPIVAMTRLGDSDIWSVTATVPVGARFTYWQAENRTRSPHG